MATIAEMLELALAHHRAGRLREAEAACRQVLAHDPRHVEALHSLGNVLKDQGQIAAAIACFEQALAQRADVPHLYFDFGNAQWTAGSRDAATATFRRLVEIDAGNALAHYNLGMLLALDDKLAEACGAFERAVDLAPDYAPARYNLALALHKRHDLDAAEIQYRHALRLAPDWSEASNSLGTLYQAVGRADLAAGMYRRALAPRPDYAEAHYNLGVVLAEQNQLDEAMACYRQAIACKPEFPEAHYNLGTLLQRAERWDEAAVAYRQTLRLAPDHARALNNLGNVYRQQENSAAAIDCYRRALVIEPDSVEAHNNLGSLVQTQGDLEQAVEHYRRALRINPDSADTYNNLGNAYQEIGKFDEALACYDRSVSLQGDAPEPRFNRGLIHLSQQRFAEGWDDFAWRLRCARYPQSHFRQPMWDGASFVSRTLFVHAEQGFGDTLHFVRYLPAVRKLGGRIILDVQPGLVRLLLGSGFPEAVAAGSPLPPFDLHAPLLQLPAVFRTTLQTMPADVPYLAAEAPLVAQWSQRLAPLDGFKVGIAWQGNRQYAYDRRRSIPLRYFAPLGAVGGVRLVSLQKGDGTEQLAEVAGPLEIHDLGSQLDNETAAFVDTAAVMKNLDLVITSDTAIAHLAGALGVPVWVALADVPEWRWFLDREDSPWYPTMRLFRQSRPGDWTEVFARIARELGRV